MLQNQKSLWMTLQRVLLSIMLLLPACAPPQVTSPVTASKTIDTSSSVSVTQTSASSSNSVTSQPTAAPNSSYNQPQNVIYPSSNFDTVFPPASSTSVSSEGIKVQVYFPTDGKVSFGIQATLGNSITIELRDQQGNTESQSVSRQAYPQLLMFSNIKPGSLNVSIFNEQRELLNTGYQQATVPDFNTAIQIMATPSEPITTVQTGALSGLNINTSFTETSRLDETTPAELVEGLDFSSAEWRARIAADYATETIKIGQRVPVSGFHDKQVLYQFEKAPFRTYKVFFPSTYWALGAHWNPQKAVNHEGLLQPGWDCSWSGSGLGNCQTLTIASTNRSPFFLRPRGWGSYALKVEDITDKVAPPSKDIPINPENPLIETMQKGERFYYRFFAKRGEFYTVHLATESGDTDLYGGTTDYVNSHKGIIPHTANQDNSTAQRVKDLNGNEVYLKSNRTCGSSEANACYDSFQWREPVGRDYTVMVYGFKNSKFRLRVEQGNGLGARQECGFNTKASGDLENCYAPIEYDPNKAVEYVNNNINKSYKSDNKQNPFSDYGYLKDGGNCTNFVNQAILAGFVKSSNINSVFNSREEYIADKDASSFSKKWYYISDGDRGDAWAGADNLYLYASNSYPNYKGLYFEYVTHDELLKPGEKAKVLELSKIKVGDIVFANWNAHEDDIIDHSMIVTETHIGSWLHKGYDEISVSYQGRDIDYLYRHHRGLAGINNEKETQFFVYRPMYYNKSGKSF